MSLYLDPEWVEKMADKEDGLEVGAPDPEMEKAYRRMLQDRITELTEGVQHHGRVLDDMEDHSELPRGEQSSPNG